jgi:hypothetical protein
MGQPDLRLMQAVTDGVGEESYGYGKCSAGYTDQ